MFNGTKEQPNGIHFPNKWKSSIEKSFIYNGAHCISSELYVELVHEWNKMGENSKNNSRKSPLDDELVCSIQRSELFLGRAFFFCRVGKIHSFFNKPSLILCSLGMCVFYIPSTQYDTFFWKNLAKNIMRKATA